MSQHYHPQPGIFALGTPETGFLELDLIEGANFEDLVKALVALPAFHSENGVNAVIGFRPSLWRGLRPEATPADAEDWTEPIVGLKDFTMPATVHDAWVCISGLNRAAIFDHTMALRTAIDGLASVATETSGWHYKQGRDLTGFIDGNENPDLLQAIEVATVPADQPGAGASILCFQLWQHLPSWLKLPVAGQERAIGRTKADSVELPEDKKPENAHNARTVVERDGVELDILRRNVAYGTTGNHGTVFVGYSQDQFRQAEMLRRMAGVDGIRDTLTYFTTPLTGAFYVIPSATVLAEFLAASN